MADAKRAIAAHASRYVEPGTSLLLDDSTTSLAMLPFLRRIPGLTIVTNFLAVVEEVTKAGGDTRLIIAGGEYDPKYHALMGVVSERTLANLRVDRSFMSASAVDTAGVFHQDPAEVRLMHTRIEIAEETLLLVDSSKLGRRALHHVVGLDAFSTIIIDPGAEDAVVAELRNAGGRIELADPTGDSVPSEGDRSDGARRSPRRSS
jgi:DeoR/GlpR family transcriptional regulator of sugar metabolism